MNKKLGLRKEMLTELTADEMRFAGGNTITYSCVTACGGGNSCVCSIGGHCTYTCGCDDVLSVVLDLIEGTA